jgi:signal transduction histidine kinase
MDREQPWPAAEDLMADDPAASLGELIRQHAAEIERRWLERVQRDVLRSPGVELTELRDGMPDYLQALVQQLTGSSPGGLVQQAEAGWAVVAREHGITRVRLGFDISQLLHEFVVLRQVIRAVASEQGLATAGPEGVLADLLDGAIAEATRAYVAARDQELRRMQAANIGFLTHELRNPLLTARLAADRVRETRTPEQEQSIAVLDRALGRLAELIEGVLLTQRLEAGEVERRPVPIKLGDLLDPALQAAGHEADRKGVAFHARYDPQLALELDPLLTRSAIQNLVDNAVKFTDHGEVEVKVEDQDDRWALHVRDSCEGLSPEELGTIFEPFRRGNTSKAGTGLGLAIARRAIEKQGGTIQAESTWPRGCHFWISLPKVAPGRAPPEPGDRGRADPGTATEAHLATP